MRALILLGSLTLLAAAPSVALAQCNSVRITAGPLNFGNYDPLSPNATLGVATLDLQGQGCGGSNGANPLVSIGISAGQSGSVASRWMSAPGASTPLQYNLYVDSARTRIWPGDTGLPTYSLEPAPGQGNRSASVVIWGVIPPRQLVTPGAYAETLTITVTY